MTSYNCRQTVKAPDLIIFLYCARLFTGFSTCVAACVKIKFLLVWEVCMHDKSSHTQDINVSVFWHVCV